MADTPRRKRKGKPAPVVLPNVTDQPIFANLIFDADEIHVIMASLAAAISVAASESDDDPETQERVDQCMKILLMSDPKKVEALVVKLNRAHTATCRHAAEEFGEEGLLT